VQDRLRSIPLFADLDEDSLGRLAAAATEVEAPAGRALIERGRPGAGLFVLEEGEVTVEAPEGVRELGPGEVFGERSLLGDNINRTARVRAKTDVRCLAIGRPDLEQLLAEDPRLAHLLRDLGR
jgi:CRP/FNR family cyclic AMP-dependent transcriptional regulator